MVAFLASLAVFVFWTFVGCALVGALRGPRRALQGLLVSPVVGLSATLLPVFALNRAGLPVQSIAAPVTLALGALAAALLWWRRPVLPWRPYAPFAAALLLALAAAGWPMLIHGFDWIAYGNGDMVTLSNAAQYFLHHGLYDGPDAADLAASRDFSQYSWYLYAIGMHRLGNEMLLAWLAAVSGMRVDQMYMSFTVAVHMALVSAAGALVLQSRGLRLAALVTCGMLALSALSTQAVVNQLSSQIGGLALLAASLALLTAAGSSRAWRGIARHAALAGIVVGAMLLYYPEMVPFLSLSLAIVWALALARRRAEAKPLLAAAVAAALLGIALVNTQAVAALTHLLSAMGSSASVDVSNSAFPFFFKPIGLGIFWGFVTFNFAWPEPWTTVAIVAGAVLLALAAALAAWQAYRGTPAAIVAAIMLGLGLLFHARQADFGLFKLAFFIQPFIIASLVVGWCSIVRHRAAAVAPLVAVGLAGATGQAYYTLRSADLTRSPVSVWKGSTLRVKSEFESVLARAPGEPLVVDTPNFILAGLETLAGRGRSLLFSLDMERAFGRPPQLRADTGGVVALHRRLRPELIERLEEVKALEAQLDKRRMIDASFDMKDGPGGRLNPFRARRLPAEEGAWLIATTGLQSVFNRRRYGALATNFALEPLGGTVNHLAFVHSDLGQLYVARNVFATAFWQLEPDHFFPARTMTGAGAVFLFGVVNPSPGARLALELTATLNGDQEHKLPPAAAVGAARVALPLVGRGSARVFSPPLTPQSIDGGHFLSVDMNATPKPFPPAESGLRSLYGSQFRVDRRRLVGFVRDISLISEDEYSLPRPAAVGQFPGDLANPMLEYSGVYEDGWSSEAAFFVLGQRDDAPVLRVKGSVPLIGDRGFTAGLQVLVDGKVIMERKLTPGAFNLAMALPAARAPRRIDLRFSAFQRVPGGSKRAVAAKLEYVGFQKASVEPAKGST